MRFDRKKSSTLSSLVDSPLVIGHAGAQINVRLPFHRACAAGRSLLRGPTAAGPELRYLVCHRGGSVQREHTRRSGMVLSHSG